MEDRVGPRRMRVIYIAGPFTAATPWLVESNVRHAEEACLKICSLGCNVTAICPHAMFRHFHGQETPDYWYDATLELLRRSDAILLLDGWVESKGALEEQREALRLNMPMFNERDLESVKQWASTPDVMTEVIFGKQQ